MTLINNYNAYILSFVLFFFCKSHFSSGIMILPIGGSLNETVIYKAKSTK